MPKKYNTSFERYAFAKLIQFITRNSELNHSNHNLEIHTDALEVLNLSQNQECIELARQFVNIKNPFVMSVKVKHIKRKGNGLADKYSREYLKKLMKKEYQRLKEEVLHKIHPNINFFHTSQLQYCSKILDKNNKNRMLCAMKHNHLLIDCTSSEIKIMTYSNRHYHVLQTKMLNVETLSNDLLSLLVEYKSKKKILIALHEKYENLFYQLTGLKDNNFDNEYKEKLMNVVNNLDELFIYEKSLTEKRKIKKTFKSLSKKERIDILLEKAKTSKKAFSIVVGWDLLNYKKSLSPTRELTTEEIAMITQKRKILLGLPEL